MTRGREKRRKKGKGKRKKKRSGQGFKKGYKVKRIKKEPRREDKSEKRGNAASVKAVSLFKSLRGSKNFNGILKAFHPLFLSLFISLFIRF